MFWLNENFFPYFFHLRASFTLKKDGKRYVNIPSFTFFPHQGGKEVKSCKYWYILYIYIYIYIISLLHTRTRATCVRAYAREKRKKSFFFVGVYN